MERDMSQALCRCGCGFYGSPATDGMCSKCYKDAMKRKQAPPAGASTASNSSSSNGNNSNNSIISTQISNAISNSLNEATASTVVASLAAALNVRPEAGLPSLDKDSSKSDGGSGGSNASVISADKVSVPDTQTITSSSPSSSDIAIKVQKKKKTRCTKCKVNVGCIGFPCRCGGVFCATHRYANEHACTFDYKEHGAEEIRKNNPQIVGEKIQKI